MYNSCSVCLKSLFQQFSLLGYEIGQTYMYNVVDYKNKGSPVNGNNVCYL